MRFQTRFVYHNREEKARYVWEKYREILGGKLLDVGADRGWLRAHLSPGAEYTGIGFGEGCSIQFDLEKGSFPFSPSAFDCVLCLDVLEHTDNLHSVFDELCRVSRRYVIISLPNPLASLYFGLTHPEVERAEAMKFYGLPIAPPPDRHKWFFDYEDAEQFVVDRGARDGMQVVQLDAEAVGTEGWGWRGRLRRLARRVLLRPDIRHVSLYAKALWAVLEKRSCPA